MDSGRRLLSRRTLVSATIVGATMATSAAFAVSALATEIRTFDQKAFAEAQKAGGPIFVGAHASWCPTCKAQDPILGELMSAPKFKDLVYFVIDFDGRKAPQPTHPQTARQRRLPPSPPA
jgi:thiol-disulfide isomerase/thioredoxin